MDLSQQKQLRKSNRRTCFHLLVSIIPGIAKVNKKRVPEKLPEALESAISKAYEIDYADLPEEIKSWIIEHPYQTTFYIVNGIVFFYPQLITGPVLWSLGWTSAGPRAGKSAPCALTSP